MGFSSTLKKSLTNKVKSLDLFKTPVTFMADNKKEYGSTTAGIVSLLLIIFFAQMLIREGVSLLNREKITYEQFKIDGTTTKKLGQPKDKSFMFALGIDQMDLINGSIRYFDFEMVFKLEKRLFQSQNQTDQGEYDQSDVNPSDYQADDNMTNDGNVSLSYIDVEALDPSTPKNIFKPCNRTYWQQKGFGRQFNRLELGKWYCPSEQTNFFLIGKSSSKMSTSYEIRITGCHEAQGLAPCASEEQIQQFSYLNEGFTLQFYYIDTMISPGVQNYLTHALTDTYEWTLSPKLLLKAQVFLAQYVIQTDNSYVKDFNDFSFDSGVAIIEPIQYETLPAQIMKTDTYAIILLQRDPISRKYDRSFGKIDTLFAYIGGLLGTFMGLAGVFMNWYNKIEFEVNQMKHLYSFKNKKSFDTDSFNIFRGLVYYVLSKLYNLGLKKYLPKNQYYEDLHKYLQEGRKNIDMDLIIQKVMLAQKLGMILLSKEQFKALVLSDPLNVNEAKEIREQIQMQKDINRLLFEQEDTSQDLDMGNKISNSEDSSIIGIGNSSQRIDDKINPEKDDSLKKKKKDISKEDEKKIKKLQSEMIEVMSKLQEKVDEENHIAQRIMNRINPVIKEKYIQSIVKLTPKKEKPSIIKVNPKINQDQRNSMKYEIVQVQQ